VKILIVEDEVNIRNGLVKIVKNINENLDVYETGAAGEGLIIAETEAIDAFFLDIQLKDDYTGLWLAEQIRELERYKFTPIIFITGVHCRELEAFRSIQCYKYILKPFTEIEVARIFRDVITHGIVERKTPDIIKIKEKGFTYVMNQDDLIYVESRKRKLFISTIYEETDITSYSLIRLSQNLSEKFIQCHKCFIVNRSYIRKIDRINDAIYVHKKEEPIPIGRKYKERIRDLAK
jgi:two-component system LytT family response regulator